MQQRVSLVTLGVSDYARAKAFYEALGWSAALDLQETAFFQANGPILVLWAREKLADDVELSMTGRASAASRSRTTSGHARRCTR